VVERPGHGVTIAVAFRAYMTEPDRVPALLALEGLPDELRETLRERL
jgi:hypothetical protein